MEYIGASDNISSKYWNNANCSKLHNKIKLEVKSKMNTSKRLMQVKFNGVYINIWSKGLVKNGRVFIVLLHAFVNQIFAQYGDVELATINTEISNWFEAARWDTILEEESIAA